MGEYEYNELFESNFLSVTSRIVFVVFIMLASIVLINLMIGLAVNDIQGLEKEVGMIYKYSEIKPDLIPFNIDILLIAKS